VPWYRAWWEERRRRGERGSRELLANWPILDKETLRANPRAFVAEDCNIHLLYGEQTSGTTGKPISLWWSRAAVREWFALSELRLRRWHGVSRDEAWAILGGQPIVPVDRTVPPFWIWNRPMNQLYLSANHISPTNAPLMIEALNQYEVTHLITYASSAVALVNAAAGRRVASLRTVITNSEPLYPWQRERLETALGCAVRETYGMAEIVAAASECPMGRLHLWPDAGLIEVMDDEVDHPAAAGTAGRLICTGLLNPEMPLIRYQVGDRARPAVETGRCGCGRTLPVISGIEGRSNDLLLARDGRRVYWVNPILYGLPLLEAQIIQESFDLIRVRCVAAPGFNRGHEARLRERLQQRMGEIAVVVELVASIPRGERGKFRAVICQIPGVEQPR
jgi:phenylacetate-CoA ligase